MDGFECFTADQFTKTLRSWMLSNISCVAITCGFLEVSAYYGVAGSPLRLLTQEGGEVTPGSLRWFTHRFFSHRCLYGLTRSVGLINWDWELADDFTIMDQRWYEDMLALYGPYLRCKIIHGAEIFILVENLFSNTYVKICPLFPPVSPSPVIPLEGVGLSLLHRLFYSEQGICVGSNNNLNSQKFHHAMDSI